jgi:hypothetical protein
MYSVRLHYHGATCVASHENAQNMRLIISPNVRWIGACLVNSDRNFGTNLPRLKAAPTSSRAALGRRVIEEAGAVESTAPVFVSTTSRW